MSGTTFVQGASYSVEVPNADTTVASCYLRVGYPDSTSVRETCFYSDNLKTQLPGILMLSPADIKFYSTSTSSLKTSAESLAVSAKGTQVLSCTYSYEESGSFRDVSYKIGQGTSWSIGAAQSWKMSLSTDVSLTNSQSVAIGLGLAAKISSDVKLDLGLMSVTSDKDGIEVKSVFGDFKSKGTTKTSASENIVIGVSPLTLGTLAAAQKANLIAMGITAAMAGVCGVAMTGFGAVPLAIPANAQLGKDAFDYEKQLKGWSKGTAGIGIASVVLLTVCQAMYVTLGASLVVAGKIPTVGVFPTIKLDSTSITLSVGFNTITLDATGVRIASGPTTVDLTSIAFNARAAKIKLYNMASNVSLTAGVAVGGPTVGLRGGPSNLDLGATATMSAPSVSIRGMANLAANAPMITFGP